MCLAVPMKLVEINGDSGVAELWEVRRDVDLSLVTPIEIGDYVLIHAGFALSKINEKEALKTIEYFEEISAQIE